MNFNLNVINLYFFDFLFFNFDFLLSLLSFQNGHQLTIYVHAYTHIDIYKRSIQNYNRKWILKIEPEIILDTCKHLERNTRKTLQLHTKINSNIFNVFFVILAFFLQFDFVEMFFFF